MTRLVTHETRLHPHLLLRVYENGEWAAELVRKGQRLGDVQAGTGGRMAALDWAQTWLGTASARVKDERRKATETNP